MPTGVIALKNDDVNAFCPNTCHIGGLYGVSAIRGFGCLLYGQLALYRCGVANACFFGGYFVLKGGTILLRKTTYARSIQKYLGR